MRSHYVWAIPSYLTGKPHIWHQRTRNDSRLNYFLSFLSRQIIVISRHIQEGFPIFLSKKTLYLPNPIQAPPSNRSYEIGELRKIHNIPLDAKLIITVGTVCKQKGIDFLTSIIDYTTANRTPPKVFFVLIGKPGDFSKELFAWSASQPKIFKYVGYSSFIGDWMREADLLLQPAINEGHGRTLIEASSIGLSVLCAKSGGHTEIIEKLQHGLMFTPNNIEEATEKLSRILNDRNLREQFSRRGIDNYAMYPTRSEIIENLSCIYQGLFKNTNSNFLPFPNPKCPPNQPSEPETDPN